VFIPALVNPIKIRVYIVQSELALIGQAGGVNVNKCQHFAGFAKNAKKSI
jgi:hypothetical protein